MIKEVLFGTFVCAVLLYFFSKIFKFSKYVDYLISVFVSLVFTFMFYSSFDSPIFYIFMVVGPLLLWKILLDDFFIISYTIKYYESMIMHIMGFFLFSLLFYVLYIITYSSVLFSIFMSSILVCILYCFYFVFGYRKKDELDASQRNLKKSKLKHDLPVLFGLFSSKQKDNLSSIPLSVSDIEIAEENAYNHLSDADMRKKEKEINIAREHVHKTLHKTLRKTHG